MRLFVRLFVLLVFAVTVVSFAGCKSNADKFCDHMRKIYGDKMDDCEKDALPEVQKQCKDPEAVFECVLATEDKKTADKCYKEKCEKK